MWWLDISVHLYLIVLIVFCMYNCRKINCYLYNGGPCWLETAASPDGATFSVSVADDPDEFCIDSSVIVTADEFAWLKFSVGSLGRYAYPGIASGLKVIMPQARKPLLMFSAVMEACHAVLNKVENVHLSTLCRVLSCKNSEQARSYCLSNGPNTVLFRGCK